MIVRRRRQAGFTLVEMMVAMAAMGIIMTFAAFEFSSVINAHLFAVSHLSAEQQARIAMQKVAGISRAASVVDTGSDDPMSTPPPAVSEPSSTTGPRFVFTQVASLDPNDMTIQNGVPVPCYNNVQIYLQNTVGAVGGTVWEQADPHDQPCKGFDYSRMPLLIARNVADFEVTPVKNTNAYENGYRVDITIYGYDDRSIDSRAGASYHLESVITPIVFGAAQ